MSERAAVPIEPPSVPTIVTERLRLRPWRREDVPAFARMLHDPEVMRYMGSGVRHRVKRWAAAVLGSVTDVEARWGIWGMTRHWQRHRFGHWATEDKASGQLIGSVGLSVLPDWHADVATELGWLLARPAWGRGFGMEAGLASLAYGFDELRLPRIVSVALVANARSERLICRLGFAFVGRTRWKRSDVVWYAMDREAWERREV